jgi:glycerophosphoryl diester phosphodiesterase
MQAALSILKPDLHWAPPVIGHRGACASAPENTLAAFRRAYDQGVTWIETDVKLTHEGIPILMHDDMLDRTTSGKGLVADTTWAVMQKLDAGRWFGPSFIGETVPQLAEGLRFVIERNMRINLELKPCPGRAQATTMVALIETAKLWPDDRPPPLISSFDITALTIASGLHPEWPRALALDEWRDDWAGLVRQTGAAALTINAGILTRARIGVLAEARLPILAYTVNEPAQAKELLQWGVSAVFSDDPQAIIKAL